jgi:O-succinylbenzoate synthase
MLDEYCPDLLVLSIPLRNTFRGIDVREVALFRGSTGWSEFSPFLEYDDQESATWMRAALEAANEPWPELFHDRIAINATLPLVTPEEVGAILERFPGSTTVKMKINSFLESEGVVEEVLSLNPTMKIRLDVNGGWSASEAISELSAFHDRFGGVFEYVEQPCSSVEELARVKAECAIPIAADEAIRKHLDGNFEDFSRYADLAILKWQPLGGFKAAHVLAREIGLPVVVSSALETGIGISHGLALAASFQNLNRACGLGTVALFEADISLPTALVEGGFLDVQRREPVGFERYLASPEREEHWKRRILRTLQLVEGRSE